MSEPVSEVRQKAYFEKARKGVLTWLAKRDGAAATLAEMHDHSSERFLIAHHGFSKMMESFVGEGLVAYDESTRTAILQLSISPRGKSANVVSATNRASARVSSTSALRDEPPPGVGEGRPHRPLVVVDQPLPHEALHHFREALVGDQEPLGAVVVHLAERGR